MAALPRISLQQRQTYLLRTFSSTTEEEKKKDESSFRNKMEGRKEQGLLAMASGKELAKKYGPVFAGTYGAVYVSTVFGLFLGIESGVLDPAYVLSWVSDNADEAKSTVQVIIDFMEQHTLTKSWAPFVERNPEVANLAVAWIATKFTEPIRLVVSAAIVPTVHRTLGFEVKEETSNEKEDNTDDNNDVEKKENDKKESNSAETRKR